MAGGKRFGTDRVRAPPRTCAMHDVATSLVDDAAADPDVARGRIREPGRHHGSVASQGAADLFGRDPQ